MTCNVSLNYKNIFSFEIGEQLNLFPEMEEKYLIAHSQAIIDEQKIIDLNSKDMASEIIDQVPTAHIFDAAKGWVITALQYCRNSEYWEERCKKAEAKIDDTR